MHLLHGYIAFMSADRLTEELKKAEMYSLFTDIEMPLIYSLFHMEQVGIKAERERLKEYGDRLKVQIVALEQKIYEETGETFNINSPKQLGEVLFDHMKLPNGKRRNPVIPRQPMCWTNWLPIIRWYR